VGEKGVCFGAAYGFFSTAFPFSQTQMGVPYIRATFRARRAAAGTARFTDSKIASSPPLVISSVS
jgi:hypothetical protein